MHAMSSAFWFQLTLLCMKAVTFLAQPAGLTMILCPLCLNLPSIEIFWCTTMPSLFSVWDGNQGIGIDCLGELISSCYCCMGKNKQTKKSEICSKLVAASFQVGTRNGLAFGYLIALTTAGFEWLSLFVASYLWSPSPDWMTVRTVSAGWDLASHWCAETQPQQEVPYLSQTGRMCWVLPPWFSRRHFS